MDGLPVGRFREEWIFAIALIVSCSLHALFLTRFALSSIRYSKKDRKQIEVVYTQVVPEKETAKEKQEPKEVRSLKQKKLQDSRLLLKKNPTGSPVLKDEKALSQDVKMTDKPASFDRIPVERRISVPPVKSGKINNPLYLNYYQLVRSRIKDQAYRNYTEYTSGEVYLTFVLLSDGTLKQLKLIEEKTSAEDNLRQIGMKSIRESNPFPAFPADLKYPELSFNVVISFEVREKEQ